MNLTPTVSRVTCLRLIKKWFHFFGETPSLSMRPSLPAHVFDEFSVGLGVLNFIEQKLHGIHGVHGV